LIEAGCKPVIGWRLKRSGMFWTVRAGKRIIALCIAALRITVLRITVLRRINGRFEDYWEQFSAG